MIGVSHEALGQTPGAKRSRKKRGQPHHGSEQPFYDVLTLEEILEYFSTGNARRAYEENAVKAFLNVLRFDKNAPLFRLQNIRGDKAVLLNALHTTFQHFKPERSESEGMLIKNGKAKIVSSASSVVMQLDKPKRDITESEAIAIALMAFSNPDMADPRQKKVLSGTPQQQRAIFNAIQKLNETLTPDCQVNVKFSRLDIRLVSKFTKAAADTRASSSEIDAINNPEADGKANVKPNNLEADISSLENYINHPSKKHIAVPDVKIINDDGETSLTLYKATPYRDENGKSVATEVFYTKRNDAYLVVFAKRGDQSYNHETLKLDSSFTAGDTSVKSVPTEEITHTPPQQGGRDSYEGERTAPTNSPPKPLKPASTPAKPTPMPEKNPNKMSSLVPDTIVQSAETRDNDYKQVYEVKGPLLKTDVLQPAPESKVETPKEISLTSSCASIGRSGTSYGSSCASNDASCQKPPALLTEAFVIPAGPKEQTAASLPQASDHLKKSPIEENFASLHESLNRLYKTFSENPEKIQFFSVTQGGNKVFKIMFEAKHLGDTKLFFIDHDGKFEIIAIDADKGSFRHPDTSLRMVDDPMFPKRTTRPPAPAPSAAA